jgi:Coenzyme PQQ synthesis protein D (PqqD)
VTDPSASPRPAWAGRFVRTRRDDLAWRKAGDEVVILDLAASGYHALNPSGSLLWERLSDWVAGDELAGLLASAFGLTPAEAASDVAQFLDGCCRAGLLEIRGA